MAAVEPTATNQIGHVRISNQAALSPTAQKHASDASTRNLPDEVLQHGALAQHVGTHLKQSLKSSSKQSRKCCATYVTPAASPLLLSTYEHKHVPSSCSTPLPVQKPLAPLRLAHGFAVSITIVATATVTMLSITCAQ